MGSKIGKNEKKDKIWQNLGAPKWRIPLKQGRQNSKLNHSPWTDETFRIDKNEKIKFDKIWEYHKGGSLNWWLRNSQFLLV